MRRRWCPAAHGDAQARINLLRFVPDFVGRRTKALLCGAAGRRRDTGDREQPGEAWCGEGRDQVFCIWWIRRNTVAQSNVDMKIRIRINFTEHLNVHASRRLDLGWRMEFESAQTTQGKRLAIVADEVGPTCHILDTIKHSVNWNRVIRIAFEIVLVEQMA